MVVVVVVVVYWQQRWVGLLSQLTTSLMQIRGFFGIVGRGGGWVGGGVVVVGLALSAIMVGLKGWIPAVAAGPASVDAVGRNSEAHFG